MAAVGRRRRRHSGFHFQGRASAAIFINQNTSLRVSFARPVLFLVSAASISLHRGVTCPYDVPTIDTVRDYLERSGTNKTLNGGSAFPASDNFRSENDILIKNIDALQLPREIDTSCHFCYPSF
jgi:hypothetical protein